MKNLFQISFIAIALLFAFNTDMYGQRSKKKTSKTDEYFDESGNFKQRLWYGGGFVLGFSGSNVANQFSIGISPMVGYKIFEPFSVGPKASIQYSVIKTNVTGENQTVQPVSWSAGVFSRYKIVRAIFAHVEFEFENEADIVDDRGFINLDSNGEIIVNRRQRNNVFIGAGYNSNDGGLVGFEIVLLYNLTEPENSLELPIDLRFGITYNF